jgi:hypothetical protein
MSYIRVEKVADVVWDHERCPAVGEVALDVNFMMGIARKQSKY